MKLILKEEIQGLGKVGEVVEVSVGYGRNFLLPKRKAMEATPHNVRLMEHGKKIVEAELHREIEEAQELARKISTVSLSISRQAGEGEKMFGSVTSRDIVEALEKEGVRIDKRQIQLEEPIRDLGLFDVPVRLHPEVTGSVKVWVVKG
ncbi:MAG: 50S ribosomal protein L9 [Nitrospirae bacterium]|nr:50S ribosomal protein L9 [Nitrospirota bacterium]